MDKLFNNRWFLRFFSLVIATMLFLMVNMDDMGNQPGVFPVTNSEQLTLEDVELEVYYDDEQYAIVEMEDTIDIQLSGTQSALNLFQVTSPNYEVYVDLEDLGPGVHNVNVEQRDFPAGINVTTEPESVQVTLEEREMTTLPVDIEFMNENELPEGYTLGEPEVTPEEVEVQGAASQLQDIDSLQAYIDVGGAEETIYETVEVTVYGPYGEVLDFAVDPTTVDVVVPITPPSAEVPLEVETEGTLDEDMELVDFSVEPESATIYGDLDVINDFSAVEVGPVDLSGMTESETMELDIDVPDGVRHVQPETVTVQVIVDDDDEEETEEQDSEEQDTEEQDTQTMDLPLQMDNVPEEVEVTVTDEESLNVTVEGDEDELDDLIEDDVRLYIDYDELDDENMDEGDEASHDMQVEVEGPNGFMYEPDPESVEVEITNPEDSE
ncbi:hypothetical protein HUG15_04125 [Salicibibacter cibarius]|uniref:YbbR-like domain-containing protein n=1 Tax=Salicibibacter cibarius TaxID=2743000 RepID=A0A7T7CAM4_9BACI|nr:CdaR family protein [Salicibibacter cibarius]QQK74869.1 hypothetical protein HUG15_04125 [Salicibibacter cibarius]